MIPKVTTAITAPPFLLVTKSRLNGIGATSMAVVSAGLVVVVTSVPIGSSGVRYCDERHKRHENQCDYLFHFDFLPSAADCCRMAEFSKRLMILASKILFNLLRSGKIRARAIVARESDPSSNLLVTIRRLFPCQFPLTRVPFFLKRSKSRLTLRPWDFECNRHGANVMNARFESES